MNIWLKCIRTVSLLEIFFLDITSLFVETCWRHFDWRNCTFIFLMSRLEWYMFLPINSLNISWIFIWNAFSMDWLTIVDVYADIPSNICYLNVWLSSNLVTNTFSALFKIVISKLRFNFCLLLNGINFCVIIVLIWGNSFLRGVATLTTHVLHTLIIFRLRMVKYFIISFVWLNRFLRTFS